MEFTDKPFDYFGEELLDISVPSNLTYKTPLVYRICRELSARGCLPPTGYTRAELCFEEALINAIMHGNKLDEEKEVHVKVFADDKRWGVVITDQGEGFGPDDLPDPNDPEFLISETGRGIILMEDYLDELTYNSKGNRVTMVRAHQAEPDEVEEIVFPDAEAEQEVTEPVTVSEIEGVVLVRINAARLLDDDLDAVSECLKTTAEQKDRIVVDMSRLTFIPSTGLGAFVAMNNRLSARKGKCILAAVRPPIMDIFKTVRLDKLFKIVADVDGAVAELKADT